MNDRVIRRRFPPIRENSRTETVLPTDLSALLHDHLFWASGVADACGLDIESVPGSMRGAIKPSTALLEGLVRSDLTVDEARLPEFRVNLLKSLHAEWDAELFCQELERRVTIGTTTLTTEFRRFERLWRRDELDHALGFARVYAILYGEREADILDDLRRRSADFGRLDPLLGDEFAVCLLLAYDELATTLSYTEDWKQFYPQFGNTSLTAWMKRLAADEARHYGNLITILKERHTERLGEAERLLDQIFHLDCERNGYAATFVLDHDDPAIFPTEQLAECRRRVLKSLGLSTD